MDVLPILGVKPFMGRLFTQRDDNPDAPLTVLVAGDIYNRPRQWDGLTLGNVEAALNRQLSVQGSYDNLNDVSSSPLGNLGVDLRWRLEFK